MASKSSPIDPQSHRIPAFPHSNYVHMSVGTSNQQSPATQIGNTVVIPALVPSTKHSSRKQRPIVSGLPKKVYDLSSLLQIPSSESIPETEPVSPLLTSNSSTTSHVSQLLSLLPRKRQRRQRSTGPNAEREEGFEDKGYDESSPEDEDRVIPRRKPILKRGDEASHLCQDEREEYEKKRDERLTHYKLVDAFELHTEEVLWI